MSKTSNKIICVVCNKTRITYVCQGCLEQFCLDHLSEHRKNLGQQFDQMENDYDQLRQDFKDQRRNPLIEQIDQWEKDSINKIKQTADQCREKLINYFNEYILQIEKKLHVLAEQMKEIRHENEYNEIDLNQLKQRLQRTHKEFLQLRNVSIKQQTTSLINNISLLIPFQKNTRWKQLGIVIAGGNGRGQRLNQLCYPAGICIDDNDQTIYIADFDNARIIEWTLNVTNGRIVAGGNGPGNQINQLNQPTDVIIDKENDSLIVADQENRRVIRWSRQTSPHGEIIISNIDCWGLTMDNEGSLYVSDWEKNEVRRWTKGNANGMIVAGGNGQGNQLDQLHHPTYLFVDEDYALYISDYSNNRVMKWMKDAKEGIVVAGGNDRGSHATQLSDPQGVIVDQFGRVYVADFGNDRVMCWCEGAKEGTMVVGGNGREQQVVQLSGPVSLSFDGEGNLYVANWKNARIQKFLVDKDVNRLMK